MLAPKLCAFSTCVISLVGLVAAQPGYVTNGVLDIGALVKSAQVNPPEAIPALPQNESVPFNKTSLTAQAVNLAVQQTQTSQQSMQKRVSENPYIYGPAGCGPKINTTTQDPTVPQNLTADSFSNNPILISKAAGAGTPPGYTFAFASTDGVYTSTGGVSSYLTMQTQGYYNAFACANKCQSISGCRAFNIYFERDPSVDCQDPAIDPSYAGQYHPSYQACDDPPANTNIVCTFWSAPISAAGATNRGQLRGSTFQVKEAGSRGYNMVFAPQTYSDVSAPKTYNGIVSAPVAAQKGLVSASMNSNIGADSAACHSLATQKYESEARSFSTFDVTTFVQGADTSDPEQGTYAGVACIIYSSSDFSGADFSDKGSTASDGTYYAYGPVYHYTLH